MKKTLDELQKSLSQQKGAIGIDSTGKSKQYWCGLSVIGGDIVHDPGQEYRVSNDRKLK